MLLPTLWPKKSLPDGCGKNRESGQPVWHPVVVVNIVVGVASVVQSVLLSHVSHATQSRLIITLTFSDNHIKFQTVYYA